MIYARRACLLTPPGTAAIAVVRLTGEGVGRFLQVHFSRPAVEGRALHGTLRDDSGVIDDPVVVVSAGGQVADLSVHGGNWVVRSVLDLAAAEGFAVVDCPSGQIDQEMADGRTLLEREVASHLPWARTELALRALLEQPALWEKWLSRQLADRQPVAREILADGSLWWLLHPPQVAIVGAANVGKSTLANQLFAQERSITADMAGTTRDWVGEIANLDGLAVMLLDTPGLRLTRDPIEREAIARGRGVIEGADLIVLVLDVAEPWQEQEPLLKTYPRAIHILNKCDRAPAWDLGRVPGIHTVASTGGGVDEVRRRIKAHFGCADLKSDRPRWWTARQRGLLCI